MLDCDYQKYLDLINSLDEVGVDKKEVKYCVDITNFDLADIPDQIKGMAEIHLGKFIIRRSSVKYFQLYERMKYNGYYPITNKIDVSKDCRFSSNNYNICYDGSIKLDEDELFSLIKYLINVSKWNFLL